MRNEDSMSSSENSKEDCCCKNKVMVADQELLPSLYFNIRIYKF